MFGKLAFLISITSLTVFVVTLLSNLILSGFYGLDRGRYRLLISLALAALFFGVYLVVESPGA